MSDGRIPIHSNDGKLAGVALWKGTMSSGNWTFRANADLDELSRKRVSKQIEQAKDRQDLELLRYRGPSGTSYHGWHGFVGVLGALGSAVLVYGLYVERSSVEWPTQEPIPGPTGIDEDSQQNQDEEEIFNRQTQKHTELLNFREEE